MAHVKPHISFFLSNISHHQERLTCLFGFILVVFTDFKGILKRKMALCQNAWLGTMVKTLTWLTGRGVGLIFLTC